MKSNDKRNTGSSIPDCGHCEHYYITHEANFPYACRALGFKSKRKPHLDVLESSGARCLAFLLRTKGR
jgi:hypothetical protein